MKDPIIISKCSECHHSFECENKIWFCAWMMKYVYSDDVDKDCPIISWENTRIKIKEGC